MQEGSVQFVKMNRFCSDAHFIKPHLRTVLLYLQCPGSKKTKQTTNKQTEKQISCTNEIEDT